MPRALVCGACGQDGSLLSRLLISKGYQVWGTSRDASGADTRNLRRVGAFDDVQLLSMMQSDFRSVITAMTVAKPDEVYVLSGQTSVSLSFEQPAEALQSITVGALNILEAIRIMHPSSRVYFAGSSEAYGELGGTSADEDTPFKPCSPYGVAKLSAYWMVKNFRDSFGLFAVSGILFNHESPLRPSRFVTQKIISAARRIAAGDHEPVSLGNLEIVRDWGWAPEYVEAIWSMLQMKAPVDLVIATGVSCSLAEFARQAFAYYGLESSEWIKVDKSLFRPSEIMQSRGNPASAKATIGWEARYGVADIVRSMADDVL